MWYRIAAGKALGWISQALTVFANHAGVVKSVEKGNPPVAPGKFLSLRVRFSHSAFLEHKIFERRE